MAGLEQLAAQFHSPPADYSPIPFWFLNGDLEPGELTRQLRLMHSIGIGTVALHARRGHTTGYLSDEWFARIGHCVEVCVELGMKAWLYDEDNWPSGYGGGEVLRRYPEGRAKCLAMLPREEAEGEAGDEIVGGDAGSAFVQRLTPWHPAYHEGWYTDLLDLRATQEFIETTHERYAETLGEHLGTTVTAVFTDEPGFYNHFYECAPGTVVWTTDLPHEFLRRRGYDLLPRLRALFETSDEDPLAGQVRADFYQVVSELIDERFYTPLREWCNDHGMMLVGHVNNEEYLVDHVRLNADMFTAMDGLDMPGIDVIAPEGNYRRAPDSPAPKLASSAAHTRGKRQVLSETYGAMGWELAPAEMRRIADWQSVRGVTRIVPHAFYYSIEGERYHECPPSLFFQSPHWPYMPGLMAYLSRWTWLLESTRPGAKVAVYYPIDAVRRVTTPEVPPSLGEGLDEDASGEAGRLGKAFRAVLDALFRRRIDFDIIDDRALRSASISEGGLQVCDLRYECVVLPPGEPSAEAKGVLDQASASGITIISAGCPDATGAVLPWATVRLDPAASFITATRRDGDGGSLFFLVNEGDEVYEGSLTLPASGQVTAWDLGAGQVDPWPAREVDEGMVVDVMLLPGSAVCFGVDLT